MRNGRVEYYHQRTPALLRFVSATPPPTWGTPERGQQNTCEPPWIRQVWYSTCISKPGHTHTHIHASTHSHTYICIYVYTHTRIRNNDFVTSCDPKQNLLSWIISAVKTQRACQVTMSKSNGNENGDDCDDNDDCDCDPSMTISVIITLN